LQARGFADRREIYEKHLPKLLVPDFQQNDFDDKRGDETLSLHGPDRLASNLLPEENIYLLEALIASSNSQFCMEYRQGKFRLKIALAKQILWDRLRTQKGLRQKVRRGEYPHLLGGYLTTRAPKPLSWTKKSLSFAAPLNFTPKRKPT
jgi:hypothetical protein